MKTIIHCGHHKCGSVLFGKVLRKICQHLGLAFCGTPGPARRGMYEFYDVVFFANSTIEFARVTRPYLGTHMIRDPRDVIVSCYLYHMRCKEGWCTNVPDLSAASIDFPQVPYSQYSRPERWKREYLHSLHGSSYQDNINGRDEHEGIVFEMNNYGRWTIESMLGWNYNNPNMAEIKFEDVMRDFTGSFERVFTHYGFSESVVRELLAIIDEENMNNLSDQDIQESCHIHSRQTSKWKQYFSAHHKALFKDLFGDALVKLGYEKNNDW